jgi:hypothetical protein
MVVATAATLTASTGILTAHADPGVSFVDTWCGDNVAMDGVYFRACLFPAYDDMQPNSTVWAPGVIVRIPNALNPNSWNKCFVRTAIFRNTHSTDYTRMRPAATTEGTTPDVCLSSFRKNSQNNTRFFFYDADFITLQPGACYRIMGRWSGTYAGASVGMGPSGPFAYSVPKCGQTTGVAVVDQADVPSGPDLGDVADLPTMVEGS